jgi:hypothetical protein
MDTGTGNWPKSSRSKSLIFQPMRRAVLYKWMEYMDTLSGAVLMSSRSHRLRFQPMRIEDSVDGTNENCGTSGLRKETRTRDCQRSGAHTLTRCTLSFQPMRKAVPMD